MKRFSFAYFATLFVFLSGCTVVVSRHSTPDSVYGRFEKDVLRAPLHFTEYPVDARLGCNGKMGDFDVFVHVNFRRVRQLSFRRAPSGLQRPGYHAQSSYEAEVNGSPVILSYQCTQHADGAVATISSHPKQNRPAEAARNRDRALRAAEERRTAQRREREARQKQAHVRDTSPPPPLLGANTAMQAIGAMHNNGVAAPSSDHNAASLADQDKNKNRYSNNPSQQNHANGVHPSAGAMLIKQQRPPQMARQRPKFVAQHRPQHEPVRGHSAEFDPNMTVTKYDGPAAKTIKFTSTGTGRTASLACSKAKTLALAKVNKKMDRFVSAGEKKKKGYAKGGASTGRCTLLGARNAKGDYKAKVTARGYITQDLAKKESSSHGSGKEENRGHKP